jgi:hypothetical protein
VFLRFSDRRPFGKEAFITCHVGFGPRQLRFPLGDLSLGRIQVSLKRPRVDFEEHVALFDLRTFRKVHLDQVPANTRTNVNFFHRSNAPGVFVVVDHLTFERRSDRYCRR